MQGLVLGSDAELVFLIVMMLTGFIGSIWMVMHASEHFSPVIALILLALNIWTLLETTVPIVFFGYLAMWLVGNLLREISARSQLRQQLNMEARVKAQSFGLKRESLSPEEDAEAIGLPSLYPREASTAISFRGSLPELDELLERGQVEEALKIAEEGWERSIQIQDEESAKLYRYYIERIQRGEW